MGFDLTELKKSINSLKTNISTAYDTCKNKGATIPDEKTSKNLADCISSIPQTTSSGVDMNAQPCDYFDVTWTPITDPSDIPQEFTIDFSQIGVNFKAIVIYSKINDGYFSITKIDSTKCVISAHPFLKYDDESIYGVTDMGEGTYRANYVINGNTIKFTRANYENDGVNYPGTKNDNFRTLPMQLVPIDESTGQVEYKLELINVIVGG